jgi:hypothetical protein
MTIEEMDKDTGPLPGYAWYILLVFCWYFLDNIYTSIQPLMPGSFIEPLLGWVYRTALVPFLLAGVYGGIHAWQRIKEISSIGAFFHGVKTNYLRFMGANLLATAFIIVVTIVAVLIGVMEETDFSDNKPLLAAISIPYSAITLFWFVESL